MKMIQQAAVLLVDDEPNILNSSKLLLESSGITGVMTLNDSRKVLEFLESQPVSVILLDLHMPHVSGLELLPELTRNYPQIPVILMTAVDVIETAVTCIKAGAFDYLVKPVDSGRLVGTVQKALKLNDLSNEFSSLKEHLLEDKLNSPEAFAAIITGNRKMRAVFQYVEVIAGSRQPVMVTGETGVGKELFARAIHALSGCQGEYVAVNVAGLDDNMFSDTLFGHKKGAFTGADQARDGLIARAAGGTLFLDEIGDLQELSQIKLLRLLQEREYYAVGSDVARKSDARIVLATNRDIKERIAAGRFRNDLYYRLCTHQVAIPPLRERLDDLPLLLEHFLATAAEAFNRKKPTPPNELITLLSLYTFPGNVRELEAMVYDAVARHTAGILSMESFRRVIGEQQPDLSAVSAGQPEENALAAIFGHFPNIREVEDYMISAAMKLAKSNQGIAASLLGMTRQTLNNRLKGRPE